MPTDVSSFKNIYKKAIDSVFPETAKLVIGEQEFPLQKIENKLRYGTNPHQAFGAYYPVFNNTLSCGSLEILKGGKDGLSLTNLQDISQAMNILKYFNDPACAIMKHVNPCGFKVQTQAEPLSQIYKIARSCDERSAFGSIIGFNRTVDVETAEIIMESFVEGVIASGFTDEALEILKRNENSVKLNNSIRVIQFSNLDKIPKYAGDDVNGFFNIRNLADGSLTFEFPYLTRIKSGSDFITDPMVPNSKPDRNNGKDFITKRSPTNQEIKDCLTAWYININVRSNGIVFVKDGAAIAIGTGEQERVGAIEQAINKAKDKGHSLNNAVMSSDGFFPFRDSIDTIAAEDVTAVTWPAGSLRDRDIIAAANEHNIALLATLERCFLHI